MEILGYASGIMNKHECIVSQRKALESGFEEWPLSEMRFRDETVLVFIVNFEDI